MEAESKANKANLKIKAEEMESEDLWFIVESCSEAELTNTAFKYLMSYLSKDSIVLDYQRICSVSKVLENKMKKLRVGWKGIIDFQSDLENFSIISKEMLEDQTEKIEEELRNILNEILKKLEGIEVKGKNSEIAISLAKSLMLRYLSEVEEPEDFNETVNKALVEFNKTYDLAKNTLETEDELHLRVCYNFALFYYNILDEKQRAVNLLDSTYRQAISENQESNRETAADEVIKSIEELMTIWKIQSHEIE